MFTSSYVKPFVFNHSFTIGQYAQVERVYTVICFAMSDSPYLLIAVTVTVNTKSLFGGIETSGVPCSPLPSAAGTTNRRVPPTFLPGIPCCQPGITWSNEYCIGLLV